MTKNSSLSLQQKRSLCFYSAQEPNPTTYQLIQWVLDTYGFKLHRTTVGKILKSCDHLRDDSLFSSSGVRKRIRPVKFPAFDASLYEWFMTFQDRIVTDAVILDKATTFRISFNISDEELKLTNGWLEKFKKRYNIQSLRISGEAASADKTGVLDDSEVGQSRFINRFIV
ncbi:hypothetical protein GEMRC1_008570 [Eukaryota sp. GEM-RC1]